MDDQTTQATTPAVEDNSPAANATAEPTTSVETAQAPTTDATVETPTAPAVEAEVVETARPSRAQSRIQELNAKLKEVSAQPSYVPQFSQSPAAPNLSDLIGNQESIDPDQLNQLGQQLYQQGAQTGQGISSLEVQALRAELAQKEAVSNYSSDEVRVEKMMQDAGLAENSVLDAKIAQEYQARAVKKDANGRTWIDPSVRLTDIAAANIELARASAEHGKAQTASNLQTLQDNSAITPNSDTVAPAKSFDDMSLNEQEAYLRSKGHDV